MLLEEQGVTKVGYMQHYPQKMTLSVSDKKVEPTLTSYILHMWLLFTDLIIFKANGRSL